jgi:hypothetical protein
MRTHKPIKPLALALGLGLALAPLATSLARPATTLHVEVFEDGSTDPKVKLSLPMEVIAAVAGSVHGENFAPDSILDEMTSEGFDLRAFWKEIRSGNIKEFLTLEAEEARVRAWRDGGQFRVSVDAQENSNRHRFNGRTQVEIRLPEELMDYLVAANDHRRPADLVDILRRMGPTTLVEVISEDESVRVWLD